MSHLISFIPNTTAACRSLLKDLKGQTTFTLADRYGRALTIGPDEIRELTTLIENQIGEKAPAPKAPEAPKAAPVKKPTKKTKKK